MSSSGPKIRINASSPQAPAAIDLRGVTLTRGKVHILDNLNWHVPAGTCAAILGPNGSGKSTLARLLAAQLWPSRGVATVLGHTFGQANLVELRKSIRLVQTAGPLEFEGELTAHQVILTGFFATIGLYDAPTPAMKSQAYRLLSEVGLRGVADHPYATLSSGERMRCLIARALAQRPKLLLLDEPTAGLDWLAREQILATIQRMFESRAAPPTVIMITHHVEELCPATTEVLVLSHGQAAAIGKPADVLKARLLSRVYGCPVKLRRAGGRWYVHLHPAAWKRLLGNHAPK